MAAENSTVEVTLTGYQDTVAAKIAAAFPEFKTVEFDREETDRDEIDADELPALLLDLNEFEAVDDDDRGTGQLAMRCRVEARLILPYRTARAKSAARTMAGTLCAWLRLRRFTATGVKTEPAQVIGAYRDEFAFQDRYVVWRIEWAQVLQLGTYDACQPIQVNAIFFGIAPDIGPGNESKYIELDITE
jgi:hypothetical protein